MGLNSPLFFLSFLIVYFFAKKTTLPDRHALIVASAMYTFSWGSYVNLTHPDANSSGVIYFTVFVLPFILNYMVYLVSRRKESLRRESSTEVMDTP